MDKERNNNFKTDHWWVTVKEDNPQRVGYRTCYKCGTSHDLSNNSYGHVFIITWFLLQIAESHDSACKKPQAGHMTYSH